MQHRGVRGIYCEFGDDGINGAIVKSKLDIILWQLRSELQAIYGERLTRMMLYGSQARGDAEDESDIDVLVVLKGTVNPAEEIVRTGRIISALSLDHNVVISCLFMAESQFQDGQSPLLLNIRREGVTIRNR